MFKLFTDGGARGNPGPSACAYFLFDDEALYDFGGKYLGEQTNNYAEYSALISGLEMCLKKKIHEVSCFLDSELVVKQVLGLYKVSSPQIKKLHSKVKDKIKEFNKIEFKHVPREENTFADKQVNLILDTINESV